jgi:hypothetical protein
MKELEGGDLALGAILVAHDLEAHIIKALPDVVDARGRSAVGIFVTFGRQDLIFCTDWSREVSRNTRVERIFLIRRRVVAFREII